MFLCSHLFPMKPVRSRLIGADFISFVVVISLLLGCGPGSHVDVGLLYGYRVVGSGSDNEITYMDRFGDTHTITDYDFENSGPFQVILNSANIGDNLYLEVTNSFDGHFELSIFGPTDGSNSVPVVYIGGELDYAWASYEIPTNSISDCPYKYVVLGNGTNVQINWRAGGFVYTTYTDLLANASRWDSPTNNENSETDLSVSAYDGSEAVQVILDGEQVAHVEGGDSRWCTYTVPIYPY